NFSEIKRGPPTTLNSLFSLCSPPPPPPLSFSIPTAVPPSSPLPPPRSFSLPHLRCRRRPTSSREVQASSRGRGCGPGRARGHRGKGLPAGLGNGCGGVGPYTDTAASRRNLFPALLPLPASPRPREIRYPLHWIHSTRPSRPPPASIRAWDGGGATQQGAAVDPGLATSQPVSSREQQGTPIGRQVL
ncbi:unnamed protein product, partial [Urochloa humidicola]